MDLRAADRDRLWALIYDFADATRYVEHVHARDYPTKEVEIADKEAEEAEKTLRKALGFEE
jgi:hypothetical protein